MYELLNHLFLTPTHPLAAGSGPSNESVKVAIVTAIGVVLAAAVTAIASTFQREKAPRSTVRSNDNYTRDYINNLVRDQRELRKLRDAYNYLREACVEHHLDPDDLIREQERRDKT